MYNNYWSRKIKISLKELPNFESEIREKPITLLETIEYLMYVPTHAVYPILTLIETLARVMKIK